jgi:Tol biopolymer transport system component
MCVAAASPDAAWDITNTGQPYRNISFTTTEGTWMSLDVSPDGKTIVFDLLGDIYSIPVTGGDTKLIHGGPAMQRTPSLSPDGRKLLYLSDASGAENAWMSNPDGSDARQITHETANLMMAVAWGADTETVAAAYIEGRYPRRFASEIRLFDVLGGSRVLVPTPANKRDVSEPALSRDGRYVYYTERLAAAFGIYVDANHINYAIKRRDLRTGAVEELASGWGGALTPQVSPDSKRLAFVRRVMDRTVLFVLDLATNEQRAVYDGLDRDLQASYEAQANYFPHFGWFPDNRHVAIWGKGKLFKVDMDAGYATEIPFRVTAHHRITEPLRFQHDLAPAKLTVRAIRNLAPAPDDQTMIFTAIGHLWRKALPSGVPARLNKGTAFGFEPSYAADGRKIVYVEWDDERGSALKIASPNGAGAKTIATSPGVIRQPRFSSDGKRVTYRIQDADTSMGGGGRAKPGVYWVEASGGESHFVAAGSGAPQFSPDGRRIYYIETDNSGDSPADVLRSVTLDGLDKREHARAPDADTSGLLASPDLRWIAFRERQQFYVLPYRETGTPLVVSATTTEVPVRKLTEQGGYALVWSGDSSTVHWAMGPHLYRARLADPAGSPAQSYTSVDLEVPGDVPSGTVAFTNARVITMHGEQAGDQIIERGTVVVTGNRIVAVGASDQVALPADAKIMDATGQTIMPGLIDAHGHIDCCFGAGSSPQKQPTHYAALAFGVTTNFDPYPNELTSYERTETTIADITVGPRWIGTGSAIWGRTQQNSNLYTPIATLTDAENLMARKRAVGGVIIKSYRYPGRAQRQMLVKAGRDAGIMVDVEGESQFYNNITMLLDGHTNLEHNLPLAHYYDDLVQLMALAKAHNTPTLVVNFGELFGENYMYQTTEAWKDPKVKAYVQETLSGYSPLATPYGAPPYSRSMTTIQAAEEVYDVGFRAVSRATKKLDEAGVVINVGSHGEVPGLAMHWEMALLAQGGMSNMRILRAATINGANTLGIDKQVGSLEVGKLADIIVLDKNPLEDIHNTNSVRYTMVNGRLYDSLSMNEIGNYNRPRTRFYWELQQRNGIDWNEAWGGR